MRKRTLLALASLAVGLMVWPVIASAHEHDAKLPAGPIRDRHKLMEGIGAQAKKIGQALKARKPAAIPAPAEAISADAKKIPALFPQGSVNPKSRAKPEIWTNWDRFVSLANDMSTDAAALAGVAKAGGDSKAAADKLFGNCKSCHDEFRVPDKK